MEGLHWRQLLCLPLAASPCTAADGQPLSRLRYHCPTEKVSMGMPGALHKLPERQQIETSSRTGNDAGPLGGRPQHDLGRAKDAVEAVREGAAARQGHLRRQNGTPSVKPQPRHPGERYGPFTTLATPRMPSTWCGKELLRVRGTCAGQIRHSLSACDPDTQAGRSMTLAAPRMPSKLPAGRSCCASGGPAPAPE